MRLTPSLALGCSLQFGISVPFDSHVYALRGPIGIALVDAGAETHTEQLLRNLRSNLDADGVKALIITHCRVDQCGGAAKIRKHTACRAIAHLVSRPVLETGDEEVSALQTACEQGGCPLDFRLEPCPVDLGVADGMDFEAAGITFRAIHIRGHSEDLLANSRNHSGTQHSNILVLPSATCALPSKVTATSRWKM